VVTVGVQAKAARLGEQTSVGGDGQGMQLGEDTSVVVVTVDGKMTSRATSPRLLEAHASPLLSRDGSYEPTSMSPRDTSASSPLAAYAAQPLSLSAADRTVVDRTVSPRPLPASGDVADRTIVDQAIEKGP
jgi:hypothetical protein